MTEHSLQAEWELAPDPVPCQYNAPPAVYPLKMRLPGTTAQQAIGNYNTARETGYLTEKYPFAGQIWLRKTVQIPPEELRKPVCILMLERTRQTALWINGRQIGSENSLCTPHEYDVSGLLTPETEIVICVKNTDYPTRGGHMTSPDTQTNWIGITGEMKLTFHSKVYLSELRAFPDAASRRVTLKAVLHGAKSADAAVSLADAPPQTCLLTAEADGVCTVTLPLPESVPLWTEHPAPKSWETELRVTLPEGETASVQFGLRDFKACRDHFELNGIPLMLRGKHDGLVFPLEGAAPTDPEPWRERFRILKQWGINHVRFHTCCPPDAAFTAADEAGIFMEPELPFWGTIDAEGGEKYNRAEQEYLIREGLRICRAFGNHPSFVMFSLGNELWGSKERLGEIIDTLRAADPRPLYTQGSNNFQHIPVQIPQEDFWTGVRTGKGRLIRGSFAVCDAPIGRNQTHAPSAAWDYEAYLAPQEDADENRADAAETEIEIQYGTGVRRVKAQQDNEILHPTVPVISHEVGQYNVYPDFREIPRYTGVLEARNFGIFRERLEAAGMGAQAADFFRCSGLLSRDSYKLEIEAAMRTPHLAGFQLLDLQDFPGQGTALVGMLNALMENKGFIEPETWRGFCGDLVPLAIFDSFVLTEGGRFFLRYAVRSSRAHLEAQPFRVTLHCGSRPVFETVGEIPESGAGLIDLGGGGCDLRGVTGRAELVFEIPQENVKNTWQLVILPAVQPLPQPAVCAAHSFAEAEPHLRNGERVLLLPDTVRKSVRGFYSPDFWNYPMFRSISESMGREVPVGTMGLCIDETHPVARALFSECYSTPQWYEPVTHADCAVLDAAPAGYRPIVQMIDNVERNHRLGLIFEANVCGGSLLVCTVRLHEAPEDPAMNCLHRALLEYAASADFSPETVLSAEMLRELF